MTQPYPPQYAQPQPYAPGAPGTYSPPPTPYYPPAQPQQYGPPTGYPAAPPAPAPVVNASLDDFFSQPTTGWGPSLKFSDANNRPIVGQTYVGIVARALTSGDIQQVTSTPASGSIPQTYKDGRPKLQMLVPLLVHPQTPGYPEGKATWYVKGQARDELARAMAEAGAPVGPPEEGSTVTVALVGQRTIPGLNPANVWRVDYARPAGAQPVAVHETLDLTTTAVAQPTAYDQTAQAMAAATAQAAAPAQPQAPLPPAAPAQAPVQQPVQPVAPAAAQAPSRVDHLIQPQQPVQPVAPAAAQAPDGLSPEQQALLSKLTGNG